MIEPAQLSFSPEGIPFSEAYGDVYHTRSGGIGQARHVFLGGNDLPQRWRGRERFVIVETGFGLGINFLATWAAWRADPQRCTQLHFISFEKHPFAVADLATAYSALLDAPASKPQPPMADDKRAATRHCCETGTADAALGELALDLQSVWPPTVAGRHELHFDQAQVRLSLVFADAREALPQLTQQAELADAFYLDGFSPAKNPELWNASLLSQLARLAAPGATLATWSVASGVRQALTDSGWQIEKLPGFSGKREMLRAHRP
ncbi:tRNA (5-methylaminomethyl-2-thiouridine)(34)-methyltransferase MnmD [Rhodocyclus tenuis]|uniref:tRNA (5-methylaminomethyl-2-thiouridine)(34)-methyltransferase MnmD n=1 Tax=Rhodocyclus tenuis TaxID=1066 RepID=UPI001903A8FD|nr:hypothetical protein [Rhodocyclus tenuis]